MHDFRSLKIVDFFKPLFIRLGIDYPVMRRILHVKLTMDGRRVPTIFSGQTNHPKGNQFLKSLGIYALYGLMLIPLVFIPNHFLQMGLFFGVAMFILMTSMVADFSSVLLDVRDKTILSTKPIDNRTISAAKFVHVTIYMTMLTGAFLLIPSIIIVAVQGFLFAIIYLVMLFLLMLLILAVTTLVYIFVLQFFSGEKLKDIINYIQIILTIGIIIGYQVVIRSFEIVTLDVVFQFAWWHVVLPPLWFAAPFEMLLNNNFSFGTILLSCMAVIIPVIAFATYYRLMPMFERNLQKLMETTGVVKRKKFSLNNIWERIICYGREEQQFFQFATAMMAREREFKLKVYPSLGMSIVIPFIFIYAFLSDMTLTEIGGTNHYLNLYFINIMIGIVVYMLQFSGKYKGAWLFYTVPIKQPQKMYSATLKAFIVKLYLPVFIIVSAIFLYIFSIRILIDVFVVFMSAILHTVLTYHLVIKESFPFTKPFETMQQGGANAIMFLLMIIAGVLCLVHYTVLFIPYGIYGYAILLVVLLFALWTLSFGKKKTVNE